MRSPKLSARGCRRARSKLLALVAPSGASLTASGLPHLSSLGLAAAAALLALALRTEERRRQAPALPPPLAKPAEVTVLLPLRDEEENVLPCLDGLLAQTAKPAIRAIDDGSTDATARRLAARRRGEASLQTLAAGPLPPGWRGKSHALAVGAAGVSSPWLLLTDADTRHHPELLARAAAAAAAYRLDAVSLAGTQEAAGLVERLLIPAVFALLDTSLGSWEAAAMGDGPPVANGQYILLRRAALEAVGGFAALEGAAMDDVTLAVRLRAAGFRTGFFRAPGLLTVRMYRGARGVVHGWRRNLGGLYGARPAAAAAVLAWLALPPLALAFALATGRLLSAAILWAGGAAASAVFRRGSGQPPAYGLLYPLDALLLAAVLAGGVADWRRGRLATWKGREMKL